MKGFAIAVIGGVIAALALLVAAPGTANMDHGGTVSLLGAFPLSGAYTAGEAPGAYFSVDSQTGDYVPAWSIEGIDGAGLVDSVFPNLGSAANRDLSVNGISSAAPLDIFDKAPSAAKAARAAGRMSFHSTLLLLGIGFLAFVGLRKRFNG